MEKLTLIFPIATALFAVLLFAEYIPLLGRGELLPKPRRDFSARDFLCVFALTLAYAAVAFLGLGDTSAPQSFTKYESEGQYALIELREETDIGSVMYYTGLFPGDYYLQLSTDGESFVDQGSMEQSYADLFKWQYAVLGEGTQGVKYIRIIAGGEMWLGEIAVFDTDGALVPAEDMSCADGGVRLFDEQELVPAEPSYLNGSYFDEIYHARTALEHIEGIYPYEISHPPLGKLIISLGIRLFGMTPFGWRFMGALFGVLMLPALYVFLKRLFGGTAVPACCTAVFAFDFMHFVQTRIATIDTYGVFFTLLMYLFMYMYLQTDRDDILLPRRKQLVPLFLSGVCFGLGAACKWTCLYAGLGLGVLWLIDRVERGIALCRAGQSRRYWRETAENAAWCVLFFVLIPAAIYYCSYYPYGETRGLGGVSMYFSREYFDIVASNQEFMFSYHSGVDATHPYSSRWWQWMLDIRPILYYLDYSGTAKSTFGAFVSPLLCWAGLLAMLGMLLLWLGRGDKKARFIFLGYAAQLVPWIFVERITFAYHYFPCTVFLVLALGHVFDCFRRRSVYWRRSLFSFTAASLLLFAVFYPALSGVEAPSDYFTDFLKWLPATWPF